MQMRSAFAVVVVLVPLALHAAPPPVSAEPPASVPAVTPVANGPIGDAVADDVTLTITQGKALKGFDRPVAALHANDGSGRLFVVEQSGRIRVVAGGKLDPVPFFDARLILGSTRGEQGLLGLAFHPKFKENGRLFIAYTDKGEDDAVAELRVPPPYGPGTVPDPLSLTVLFSIKDPASNHNGGHLLFGPDGKLWVGTGDGGQGNDPWNNAQTDSSLLGKMLLVDVDGDRKPVVHFKGLRNPWRYSFDPQNGDLWIADVGQNDWEEVDVVVDPVKRRGLNFGWKNFEARACNSGCDLVAVPPVYAYSHDFRAGGGCSISGGVVVDGRFFFGDYCTGQVWSIRREGSATKVARLLASGRRVTSFGLDQAGQLWLVDHEGALVPIGRK
ncbi:MAG: PQQ-dependent sugar dehydrogenase [Deltaproteobacteria bacterium]|nr:PQQ-dependent sugar dehydrogenase [Deltaproteobacteria bacterium]